MNDITVGTTVSGYRILEEVGQGGMATVYRAHQISMNRDVAIKVLPSRLLNEPVSLERFKQEASIVARLEHRAIVPVHDYGEYEGIPYLVMRYMDGGSVDDLLSNGPVSPEKTLRIVQQIAPALDYAHREGVLHRDLKPSNILLDSNEDAYLTDFGIARILGSNPKPITTTGVVGTPSYMSPEQAQGHALDGRSDVYALGVVVFEMLAGVRPFEGETPYTVAVKHVTEAPPSACKINPKLPGAIEPVLFKALAKDRKARYQTAMELATALETAIRQGVEETAGQTAETEPSLNEALKAGALRRGMDTSGAVLRQPAPPAELARRPPDIQVMPPFVASASRSYTGALVSPQRKKKKQSSRLPSWLTWAVLGVLAGSLLLAIVLGGVYYLINSGEPSGTASNAPVIEDYNATAVFKLTATKQAAQQSLEPPVETNLSPGATPR